MRPLLNAILKFLPLKVSTRLGAAMIAKQRFVLADAILCSALTRRPRHFRLLELYAFSAHNSGRYGQARRRWQAVRRVRPDDAMAWCGVTANARELGRSSEAVATIEAALARFPANFVVISEAARVFESVRDFGRAADLWVRMLDYPSSQDTWVRAAAANLMRAKRAQEAVGVLSRFAGERDVRARARLYFEVALEAFHPGQADFDPLFKDGLARYGQDAHALPQVAEWTHDLDTTRRTLVEILARDPEDAEARESYVRALVRSDLIAEAEAEIERHGWPSKATPAILRTLVKIRTGDLRTATTNLAKYAATEPANEAAQILVERAQAIDDLTSVAAETAAPGLAPAAPTKDEALRDLVLRFESIGSDCSFGLVQRQYGAEPLGLLRWTETSIDMLIPAFEARFDGLGQPDNTELFVGVGGEVYVRDKRWNLVMHTFILENEVSMAALHPKMCRRFVYLKNKLIDDVRAGDKVLVFKSDAADIGDLIRLQDAISAIGPSPLLSLQGDAGGVARHGDARTSQLRSGLFVARLSKLHFAQVDEDVSEWLDVCKETERLLGRAAARHAQAREGERMSNEAIASA